MEGPSLSKSRSQWESALSSATDQFRSLISSSNSKSWRPVSLNQTSQNLNLNSLSSASGSSLNNSSSSNPGSLSLAGDSKGKGRSRVRPSLPLTSDPVTSTTSTSTSALHSFPSSSSNATLHPALTQEGSVREGSIRESAPFTMSSIDPQKVVVHRRSTKGKEVIRATIDVPFDGKFGLEGFKAVLGTPQTKQNWDKMVENAELIELLDSETRISKTNFRLGWPASPRDAITISRTTSDESTLIDVSTSLPRSPDAPAYLRPAPPYVRSHLHLFAWCIQAPNSITNSNSDSTPFPTKELKKQSFKITAFWSWDLKGSWLGMPSLPQQLPLILKSLVDHVQSSSSFIPTLSNFGDGIEIINKSFDITRDCLMVEYSVVTEDLDQREREDKAEKDQETLMKLRGKRKLENGLEFSVSKNQGWDIKVEVKPSLGTLESKADWKASAEKSNQEDPNSRITFRLKHSKIEKVDESVLVKVTVQRVEASTGLRLNDSPFPVVEVEPRNPISLSRRLLEDTASISGISAASFSTGSSDTAPSQGITGNGSGPPSTSTSPNPGNKSAAIASLVRRNYIYFTSLLQEPEAKWKHISDARGVTVTQLDSIDPTLVVYRAEATFVGVNVWDLFSTINSPGARSQWDKTLDDSILLSDLNDLSSLWHLKAKATWPVAARDSVVVQTSYKSPNSVHIFSFSTDDNNLFENKVPKTLTGTIRTQIDLRGWSVEALSPTTAHITLLEQSDPKGWTSKTATPSAMVAAVAGVGDYAIKNGGPPVATRLLGAHATVSKYDHEKSTFRLEYERNDDSILSNQNSALESGFTSTSASGSEIPHIECELRCDLETWSSNLDLVVDPPPINVSCLRRHKLSSGGGGLWLTIEHAATSLEDDAARITVRKGYMPKEKGLVLVNGARISVDVNEMKEEERKELTKRKRTKPQRVPLDLTNPSIKPKPIRAFQADGNPLSESSPPNTPTGTDPSSKGAPLSSSVSSTFSRSSETGLGISRPGSAAPSLGSDRAPSPAPSRNELFSDSERPRKPMTCALDVLFLLRRLYSERSPDPAGSPAGWSLVSERNGLFVRRKLMQSISNTVFVQRGDKVVQGLAAEDLVNAISTLGCRKMWDDKIETAAQLESYGNGATTSSFTTKASFPFRGRAFHIASLTARATPSNVFSLGGSGRVGGASRVNGDDSISSPTTNSSSSSITSPTVYFHASASFPEQHSAFPSSRINPQNLPIGKVLIDGWILETLDPYSSTNFQIPSTRCTHVIAIDHAGSLPSGVNTMWNTNLPRAIQLVEEFIKSKGSLPSIKNPPPFMKVLGDERDEDNGFVWNLTENPKMKSIMLLSSFSPIDRNLNLLVRIEPKKDGDEEDLDLSEKSQSTPILTHRALALSNASTTKGAASQATQSISSSSKNELNAFDFLATSASTPSLPNARRSTSMSSFSSNGGNVSSMVTPTPSTIRSRPTTLSKSKPKENVMLEAEVELKHYSNGYEIAIASEITSSSATYNKKKTSADSEGLTLGEEKKASMDGDNISVRSMDTTSESSKTSTSTSIHTQRGRLLPLESASEGRNDLPIKVTVHDLPPSAVLAATLAPSARPRRHLIRLTLPSDAFDYLVQSAVEDKKEGTADDAQESKGEKEYEEEWRRPLLERGALLRLIVRPMTGPMDVTPSSSKDSIEDGDDDDDENGLQVPVRFEGERLQVMHVNQTSAMLQRESGRAERFATLKRSLPESADFSTSLDDRLPQSLQQPIAAALQLKTDLTRKPAPASTTAAGALAAVASAGGSGSSDKAGTPIRPGTLALGDPAGSVPTSPTNPSGDKRSISKDSHESGTPNPISAMTSTSTPLMTSILASYPLSRLSGASTAVSNALANATVTSTSSGNTSKEIKSSSNAEVETSSTDYAAQSTNTSTSQTQPLSQTLSEIKFSLTTLILTAIISFLVGSLIRALASPADFVIMPSPETIANFNLRGNVPSSNPSSYLDAAASEVERYLNSGNTNGGSASGASQVRDLLSNARDMKRLIEIKRFFSWDLVVAVVRR